MRKTEDKGAAKHTKPVANVILHLNQTQGRIQKFGKGGGQGATILEREPEKGICTPKDNFLTVFLMFSKLPTKSVCVCVCVCEGGWGGG